MANAAVEDAVREAAAETTAADVETPAVAEAATETAAAETPAAGSEPEAGEETPAADSGADDAGGEQPDWRDKELKRKHAKLKEAERREAEMQQRIADLERLAAGAQPANGEGAETPAPQMPTQRAQTFTQEEVRREAARLLEEQNYQNALIETNTSGQKAYGQKWTRALENLATFGEVEVGTMQAIMATDNPHKVLYELGANPADYQRIMDLPPARRHTEFVKLSLKPEPRVAVSQAPAPVEPLRGGGTTGRSLEDKMRDDKINDDEWYRAWEEHQAAKAKKRA